MIDDEPMPTTPPQPFISEAGFQAHFNILIRNRVKRALRAGFQHLQSSNALPLHLSLLSFGEGSLARIIDDFVPDFAFVDMTPRPGLNPNRAPGDVKPSYKWSSSMQGASGAKNAEYKKALAQLNFYMVQNGARYGFLCTNSELVAFKRLDGDGGLENSVPVRWTTSGSAGNPRLTVLLALFHIGMLAANDAGWFLT